MKLTMRGCRGSIASPGPDTVRYGGNTTCLQVETAAGDTLIIDAGTGIRQLGLELMARAPVRCAIFITHTHWDHIQGLPFFTPLFVSGSEVRICGSFDPVYQKSLAEILSQQMQYCFFPVSDTELKGSISYETLWASYTPAGAGSTAPATQSSAITISRPQCVYSQRTTGYSALSENAPEDTYWNIQVVATDSLTGATTEMHQGVAMRLPYGNCP